MFFFSSRRRHTRCLSDWSSDVCSSDLGRPCGSACEPFVPVHNITPRNITCPSWMGTSSRLNQPSPSWYVTTAKIGRASCRERVYTAAGGGSVKKRTEGTPSEMQNTCQL